MCPPRLPLPALPLCWVPGTPAASLRLRWEILGVGRCGEGNQSWPNWLAVVCAVHILLPVASSVLSLCHIIYISAQCVLLWHKEQKGVGMDGLEHIALLLKLGLFLLGLLHWK